MGKKVLGQASSHLSEKKGSAYYVLRTVTFNFDYFLTLQIAEENVFQSSLQIGQKVLRMQACQAKGLLGRLCGVMQSLLSLNFKYPRSCRPKIVVGAILLPVSAITLFLSIAVIQLCS